MLAVGGAIWWAGFALVWWGYSIRTGNSNSLADLTIPGHYERSHPNP